MASIEDQIAVEDRMIGRGVLRFKAVTQKTEENGRGAETAYAQRLMHVYVLPLAEAVSEYTTRKGPGAYGKYRKLLAKVEPEQAAYLALRCVFNSFTLEKTVQNLSANIGQMIEDEARFTVFQQEHADYYDTIIKDFKRKGTSSYRHMHRVLTFKANEKEVGWAVWSQEERIKIGIKMLDLVISVTGLLTKKVVKRPGNTKVFLRPTKDAIAWIEEHKGRCSLMSPDKLPCVIPPDDWTAYDQGGFYSPAMRMKFPLVITHNDYHKKLLREADLSQVTDCVNKLQSTAWSVNKQVLEVVKQVWNAGLQIGVPPKEPLEIPPSPFVDMDKATMTEAQLDALNEWKREASVIHTEERKRVSRCFQIVRVLRTAADFDANDKLWFVYQVDFRGRVYAATSGLSPQGSDVSKGCLMFGEGKPLGDRGWWWLKVHGANKYGEDSDDYATRVQWTERHHDAIVASAECPLEHHDFWSAADKPYQFLAFCFDYAAAFASGDPAGYVSRLPISLDGSCNGLQHLSALLRDAVGGRATNLCASQRPEDIYTEVAQRCTGKITALQATDPYAKLWRLFCAKHGEQSLPRGLVKKPVMTLPYGSTRQSCTDSVYTFILKNDKEFFGRHGFKSSMWLTKELWDSINEVVVAARVAMDWLQECASISGKKQKPLVWHNPLGMPVVQQTMKMKTKKIETQLAGRLHVKVGRETNKVDVLKQRQGVSPNFIHGQDAAHMGLTITQAFNTGITAMACIHDDYGTHACDTDQLQYTIRRTFVDMYQDTDYLQRFKDEQEERHDVELPDCPPMGDLDIAGVMDADYFFG